MWGVVCEVQGSFLALGLATAQTRTCAADHAGKIAVTLNHSVAYFEVGLVGDYRGFRV